MRMMMRIMMMMMRRRRKRLGRDARVGFRVFPKKKP
jgi:hypothetical protein